VVDRLVVDRLAVDRVQVVELAVDRLVVDKLAVLWEEVEGQGQRQAEKHCLSVHHTWDRPLQCWAKIC